MGAGSEHTGPSTGGSSGPSIVACHGGGFDGWLIVDRPHVGPDVGPLSTQILVKIRFESRLDSGQDLILVEIALWSRLDSARD